MKKTFFIILFSTACAPVYTQINTATTVESDTNKGEKLVNKPLERVKKQYSQSFRNPDLEINQAFFQSYRHTKKQD